MTRFEDLEAVWQAAVDRFGKVDTWINNAGLVNDHAHDALVDVPAASLEHVVRVNVLGALFGTKVAVRGMRAQGFGGLYNILADRVETVAPWIVERLLSNTKTGVRIAWLSPLSVFAGFVPRTTRCVHHRDALPRARASAES